MLRCILESEGNEAALCEPIVRAVAGVVREFEDHGLKLVEAFDSIPLLRIMSMMRELDSSAAGSDAKQPGIWPTAQQAI